MVLSTPEMLETMLVAHTLDAIHVVGEARLDFPSARRGKEAQGHALQVNIELIAEIAHHLLTDQIVQVRLAYPDQPGEDGYGKHDAGQDQEQSHVALSDGVIEDHANQQGVDQSQNGRQENGAQDQNHLEGVGGRTLSPRV